MRMSSSTSSEADGQAVSSTDGALQFVVRRSGAAVFVERVQPLVGIGRLSHMVRLADVAAFDRAYETDEMRFKYPLVYWQVRRAVEEALGHDCGRA